MKIKIQNIKFLKIISTVNLSILSCNSLFLAAPATLLPLLFRLSRGRGYLSQICCNLSLALAPNNGNVTLSCSINNCTSHRTASSTDCMCVVTFSSWKHWFCGRCRWVSLCGQQNLESGAEAGAPAVGQTCWALILGILDQTLARLFMIALIRFRGRFLCMQLVIASFVKSLELNPTLLTLCFSSLLYLQV